MVNAAAESFADRSIAHSKTFVESKLIGTQVVLEACRAAGYTNGVRLDRRGVWVPKLGRVHR